MWGKGRLKKLRKCHRLGIEIDTIMISEEDSLLGYVNEMEKHVKGRSYYINPGMIQQGTSHLLFEQQKTDYSSPFLATKFNHKRGRYYRVPTIVLGHIIILLYYKLCNRIGIEDDAGS